MTGWSMTLYDTAVRTEGPMVHRALQLVGSNAHDDEVVLECGARAPWVSATETEDPVDCMACMIRRTTTDETLVISVDAALAKL